MAFKSKERRREYDKEYYEKNKERILKKMLLWQKENKEKVNLKNKKWKESNKEKVYITHINYMNKLKKIVFGHYGKKCSFCGSKNKLTVDHINNDGREFREETSNKNILIFIVQNDFPDDLQILCQRCNERKKRASKEGITLKEWVDNYNERQAMRGDK